MPLVGQIGTVLVDDGKRFCEGGGDIGFGGNLVHIKT